MGIFTVITEIPTIISDFTLGITTIETVWPEAVAAEQAILAAVKTPLEKLISDIEAMETMGDTSTAIITDIETFFSDIAGLGTSVGTLVDLVESKGEGIWAQLQAPFNTIKSDVQDLLPATTATVATTSAAS
jgi:hypothetical protein